MTRSCFSHDIVLALNSDERYQAHVECADFVCSVLFANLCEAPSVQAILAYSLSLSSHFSVKWLQLFRFQFLGAITVLVVRCAAEISLFPVRSEPNACWQRDVTTVSRCLTLAGRRRINITARPCPPPRSSAAPRARAIRPAGECIHIFGAVACAVSQDVWQGGVDAHTTQERSLRIDSPCGCLNEVRELDGEVLPSMRVQILQRARIAMNQVAPRFSPERVDCCREHHHASLRAAITLTLQGCRLTV